MLLLYDAEVDFKEEGHIYSVGGIEVPSTTTILKDSGFIKNLEFFTKEGSDRGSYVHKLTEQYDNGVMDWGQVGDCLPYIDAYLKATEELGLVHKEIELRLVNKQLWYSGTLDRVSLCRQWKNVPGIIDLKTGQPSKSNYLQLLLYGGLIKYSEGEGLELPLKMANLYLQKNGKYKFIECDELKMNRDAAFGAIPGYHFRRAM